VNNVITNVHLVDQLLSIVLGAQKIEIRMLPSVLVQLDTLTMKKIKIRFVNNVLGNANLVLVKQNSVCHVEEIESVKLVLVLQVNLKMV